MKLTVIWRVINPQEKTSRTGNSYLEFGLGLSREYDGMSGIISCKLMGKVNENLKKLIKQGNTLMVVGTPSVYYSQNKNLVYMSMFVDSFDLVPFYIKDEERQKQEAKVNAPQQKADLEKASEKNTVSVANDMGENHKDVDKIDTSTLNGDNSFFDDDDSVPAPAPKADAIADDDLPF